VEQQLEEVEVDDISMVEEWQRKMRTALTKKMAWHLRRQLCRMMRRIMHIFQPRENKEAKKSAMGVHKGQVETK
jgi:hypothetical protein